MEWFIGRSAFIHLNLLVLHIGKKQSIRLLRTVHFGRGKSTCTTRWFIMRRAFSCCKGALGVTLGCMDAVNSQSSNLHRIVHAGQGNCVSEYLDSGTSLQVRKISTSMQSNRCNAPESIYKHIDKCALCNGILGHNFVYLWQKIGERNKSHLCPYS